MVHEILLRALVQLRELLAGAPGPGRSREVTSTTCAAARSTRCESPRSWRIPSCYIPAGLLDELARADLCAPLTEPRPGWVVSWAECEWCSAGRRTAGRRAESAARALGQLQSSAANAAGTPTRPRWSYCRSWNVSARTGTAATPRARFEQRQRRRDHRAAAGSPPPSSTGIEASSRPPGRAWRATSSSRLGSWLELLIDRGPIVIDGEVEQPRRPPDLPRRAASLFLPPVAQRDHLLS